jgi:hypothetical protein
LEVVFDDRMGAQDEFPEQGVWTQTGLSDHTGRG